MKLLKNLISLFSLLVVLALGSWFSLRNSEPIGLDLIFVQLEAKSLALWLILSLVVGVLVGWLLGLPKRLSQLAALKIKQRQLNQQEKELHQLRTQSFNASTPNSK